MAEIRIHAKEPSSWNLAVAPYFVYTLHEAEGRISVPIYIGATSQLSRRLRLHRRGADWWPLVGPITLEPFWDKAEAYEAEERAISRQRPLMNIAGNIHTPAREELA